MTPINYETVEVYQDVLSTPTLLKLLKWVDDNNKLFKDNGVGRRRLRLQDINHVFEDFSGIESKLKSLVKHDGLIPNHSLGDNGHFLFIQVDGASTDVHIDNQYAGYKTVRINTTLAAPQSGGRLVVEGRPIDMSVGTTIVFYPSEVEHWSEKVVGDQPRITFSLSYCFPFNNLT